MTLSSPLLDAQGFPRSFAALLDCGYARPEFLQGLKMLIAAAQERIRQEHDTGARGRNVVRHLTALVDDVVRTVFQYGMARAGYTSPPCVLLALGGYGRGELNPHSDIDLMFLCATTPPDAFIRETLYLLWDVGYTLGHSVRTRRDVVKMTDIDLAAQTAMMESRFIEGDHTLFRWFQDEVCRRRFTQRRRRSFARQKLAECQHRHASFANTVNLMEPNIKESPGGLRDYHTALWLSRACYDSTDLPTLTQHGLITAADQHDIEAALDFLFRVRNALHYHSGRKNDLLSVDVQERLAANLGFEPDDRKLAVEHFLMHYYTHANAIFALCLTIQEAVTHTYQTRVWQLLRRPRQVGDGFFLLDGYLHQDSLTPETLFAAQPLLLMQAFATAQQHNTSLAPALSRAIRAQAPLLATDALRRAPEAKALLFRILAHPHATPAIRAMHRHGVLGAYLPEFVPLTCLVQYDLYHRYTVEEHTFHCIEALESLDTTAEPALQPLATLYHQTSDKALLKFALLLHDLGKDVGPSQASHVYRSGELATPVCERLDLSDAEQHLLQILIVNHLVMNHLAQRRDITDAKVIGDFAEIVETVPALEQLYLLTFADTSGVGPGVWTAWKGALLHELYSRTRAYLVRQTDEIAPSDAELRDRLRPAIVHALGGHDMPVLLEDFLDSMPARYLLATPPAQIAAHVRLVQRRSDTPVLLATESGPTPTIMNVTLCVEERRGLFAMITGALSQNNLNILGAQIYTSKLGLAIDTLQVEAWDKTPLNDPQLWQQVETDFLLALDGTRQFDAIPSMRRHPTQTRQFQTFVQEPHIVLDNTSSNSHTVIEVKAQDSLGLLYKLTRLLYEQGLNIALAKISTEANRAIDVFYVTDADGNKILDVATQDTIREHLTNALT
jgi:[protein-PII] uridylyltransferase